MTTLIIIAVALYVLYLIIDTESYNPFTLLRRGSRDAGFIVGATPKTLKTANETAKALHAESKLELAKAGKETEYTFNVGKRAGRIAANNTFGEIEKDMVKRQEAAKKELAELDLTK